MKKQMILWSLCALVCACSSLTPAQRAEQAERTARLAAEGVANRWFTAEMEYVSPRRMPARDLSPDYTVTVHGDTLISHLPYFGRAYGPLPYDGGKGLSFTAPIASYQAARTRRDRTTVLLTAQTDEDAFAYRLDIYDDGQVYLDITAQKREGISFTGHLEITNDELQVTN